MNCKLVGNFVQHLEVVLSPGEDFYAEKGALIYLEDGIEFDVINRASGIKSFFKYKFLGESIYIIRYINNSFHDKKLVIGAKYGLLPIKSDNMVLACNGSYVASSAIANLSSVHAFNPGLGFMQNIDCKGTCFLDCKGTIIPIHLKAKERLRMDENHLVAAIDMCPSQLRKSAWSLKNIKSGEGLSILEITGPGTIYVESAPAEYTNGNSYSSHRGNNFTLGCIGTLIIYALVFFFIWLFS